MRHSCNVLEIDYPIWGSRGDPDIHELRVYADRLVIVKEGIDVNARQQAKALSLIEVKVGGKEGIDDNARQPAKVPILIEVKVRGKEEIDSKKAHS